MDVKLQEARERLYDAVMALESIEQAVNGALEAMDDAFVALNQMDPELAAEWEPEPEDDPLCGICGNPKSKHKADGGFEPRSDPNEPNFYDTSADTRENVIFDRERYDFDEFYEIMGFGSLNDRDKGWKGEENA